MASNPFDQFDANPYDQFDAPQKRSAGDEALRQAGLVTRSGLNALAALPMAALEGGAGIANLVRRGGDAVSDPQGNFSFQTKWNEGLDALGLPRPESGVEKVTDVATQMLVGSRIPAPTPKGGTAPAGFQTQAETKIAQQADRVRRAQEAGYVVPPATGNPSTAPRILEGLAGKQAVGMRASAQNMDNTTRLAARAIGLSEDAPVTIGAIRAVRNEAGQNYEAVRGAGVISLGKSWQSALDSAEAAIRGANKSFPGFGKNDASGRIAALRQNFTDSSDAVDAIKVLRDYADEAAGARNFKLARTYRNLATKLEDQIERHLVANGETGLVDAFRNARQLIAKTYDVENALNKGTGAVSASKIARRLDRGAPMTGELRQIGEFGLSFPKAARDFNESLPGISPIDAYGSTLGGFAGFMASGGSPAGLLPLAYPFARLGLQKGLLTPFGQQMAMPAVRQATNPQNVMGGTYGLLALGQ